MRPQATLTRRGKDVPSSFPGRPTLTSCNNSPFWEHGPFQTSNFSRVKFNGNLIHTHKKNLRFELICSAFGTWEVRPSKRAEPTIDCKVSACFRWTSHYSYKIRTKSLRQYGNFVSGQHCAGGGGWWRRGCFTYELGDIQKIGKKSVPTVLQAIVVLSREWSFRVPVSQRI